MQGKFGGGCDGKVGGVDQFECTGEDPGGKMLKYIYAKNKRFIKVYKNSLKFKKLIIYYYIIQRLLITLMKEKHVHSAADNLFYVISAGKKENAVRKDGLRNEESLGYQIGSAMVSKVVKIRIDAYTLIQVKLRFHVLFRNVCIE